METRGLVVGTYLGFFGESEHLDWWWKNGGLARCGKAGDAGRRVSQSFVVMDREAEKSMRRLSFG